MPDENRVTILIPHYRTLDLAKLCLRSLRKYTDKNKIKVIVIDNHSDDDSIHYLRSLKWITLIEREIIAGEIPSEAHARALDLGMQSVDTEYVLSIHTDTIVCKRDWLEFLLDKMEQDKNIAGVGSWKLEEKTSIQRLAKGIEKFWQTKVWYPLMGKGHGEIEGTGKNYYYLRSHCALYRTDLMREFTDGFTDSNDTAGRGMYKKLSDQEYKMVFIPSPELLSYIKHLNHATMILNPEIPGRKTNTRKEFNRISNALKSLNYKDIIQNSALDRA